MAAFQMQMPQSNWPRLLADVQAACQMHMPDQAVVKSDFPEPSALAGDLIVCGRLKGDQAMQQL